MIFERKTDDETDCDEDMMSHITRPVVNTHIHENHTHSNTPKRAPRQAVSVAVPGMKSDTGMPKKK